MNYSTGDWIAGTVVLVGSLLIPFALRHWIVRRPLSQTVGGLVAAGFGLALFLLFFWGATLVGQQDAFFAKPHVGILIAAFVAYSILIKSDKNDDSSIAAARPEAQVYAPEKSQPNLDNIVGSTLGPARLIEFMNLKAIVTLMVGALIGAIVVWQFGAPKTYDDCILELMPEAATREAAVFINRSCRNKFSVVVDPASDDPFRIVTPNTD